MEKKIQQTEKVLLCHYRRASLVAQLVKNQPAMQETLIWFLVRVSPWIKDRLPTPVFLGFPGGSDSKKNLPEMQETWVQSLGWEDPLKEGMATHSSILAWRIPWTEEPGRVIMRGAKPVNVSISNIFPGANRWRNINQGEISASRNDIKHISNQLSCWD